MSETILSPGSAVKGDVIGGDKITIDDLQGSFIAIGRGAKVINERVTVYLQQLSRTAVLEAEELYAREQLGKAIMRLTAAYRAQVSLEAIPDFGKNPYKGLGFYDIGDAPFFYGREDDLLAIWPAIRREPLMVLYADSGAGKSSLLRAGLISALIAEGLLPVYVRLYLDTPDNQIKDHFFPNYLKQIILNNRSGNGTGGSEEDSWLVKQSLRSFLLMLKELLGGRDIYIFLDQFEDYFLLDSDQQRSFALELAACMDDPGLKHSVHWIIALRKEYFGDLDLFSPYISYRPVENRYFLKRLTEDQARQVIMEPVKRSEVRYETAVVEAILDDLSLEDSTIDPPQIQIVCQTLFEDRRLDGDDRVITADNYAREREGEPGAKGILRSYFTNVMKSMQRDRRIIAWEIFDVLVSGDRRTAVNKDTITRAVLHSVDGATGERIDEVLKQLIKCRLVRVYEEEEPLYEIIHDYLLQLILRDPENQDRKHAQEMLDNAVRAHERDRDILIEPPKLRIIKEHQANLRVEPGAQALIDQSRRSIWLRQAKIASVLLFIALLAYGFNEYFPRLYYQPPELDWATIPAGTFYMGITEETAQRVREIDLARNDNMLVDPNDEMPRHEVLLDGYQMTKYEITNENYLQCVRAKVCDELDVRLYENESYGELPVANVNWYQAQTFCEWLDGSLPTEAQWERAAKGDDANPPLFPWGDEMDRKRAWVNESTLDVYGTLPKPVGSYSGIGNSAFDLSDMTGNVWEWVHDWYSAFYYVYSPRINPTGPVSDREERVMRGGSYANFWTEARPTFRLLVEPDETSPDVGFRCAKPDQVDRTAVSLGG